MSAFWVLACGCEADYSMCKLKSIQSIKKTPIKIILWLRVLQIIFDHNKYITYTTDMYNNLKRIK